MIAMDYQPIGHINETVVAGAELEAESAITLMSLIEEKKSIEEEIQTKRESAFFRGESVFNVGLEDAKPSPIPEVELDDIISLNNGKWQTIIKECYSFRESRDPDRPLSRIEAVSEQVSLPMCDTNSMVFDTSDVTVMEKGGEEVVKIHINSTESIDLFVDRDDIKYYQGMYIPPITRDVSSLEEYINGFDKLSIRNHSEEAREILNHSKPETAGRNVKKTEVVLSHDLDKMSYIPKETYSMDEDSKLANDVSKMRSMSSLPNEKTKKFLFETLTNGYFSVETRSGLFRILTDNIDTAIKYSYGNSPEFIEQFCRLTGTKPVSIPQEEILLLTKKEIPDWSRDFNAEFPEKRSLTESEERRLYDFIDHPRFVDPTSDWTDKVESEEIILKLYENGVINQDEIVSYYASPWDKVKPTEESVINAIKSGDELRVRMSEIDEEYGTELIESIIIWEKRSIYRRSNYPQD